MRYNIRLRPEARRIVAVVLLAVIILAEWLWWESYKCTVDWDKRSKPFPLPFYILWLPHWFVVDLAILVITLASLLLALLVVVE